MNSIKTEVQSSSHQSSKSTNTQGESWIDHETCTDAFGDTRLEKRFSVLLEQLWRGRGSSIPFACQDWANTKAAYRFLSNSRVNEHAILRGHVDATGTRIKAAKGPVLVLQDTTMFTYQRERPSRIGLIGTVRGKEHTPIQPEKRVIRGFLMHSSLAITLQGLPLGLTAIKFWTRNQFKGCNAMKRHVNPTRVAIEEKESFRWLQQLQQSISLFDDPSQCIHVGDRESDIYELYCLAKNLNTHFLVRTCGNRLAGQKEHTIADEMRAAPVNGFHSVEIRDRWGHVSCARLAFRYRPIRVLPPLGKQKRYPAHHLTVIYAQEDKQPAQRRKIDWKLITDLPVTSCSEAIEKLNWYAMRWKIETFHKILKSGCHAEEVKLRTTNRLVNLIAIFCLLNWRIFWMTMINRAMPNAAATLALTPIEIHLLDQLFNNKRRPGGPAPPLSHYLRAIAQFHPVQIS